MALAALPAPVIVVGMLIGLILVCVCLWIVGALYRGWQEARRWEDNGRPREAARVRRGKGLGVPDLLRRLDLTRDELTEPIPVYRLRTVPKRRGGTRTLHVPDPTTKRIQERILHRLLRTLRAHPQAMAFERGRSIVHNALPHVGQAVVLRADVVDFFPTTEAARIDAYFRRVGWNAEAAGLLTRWTTWEGGLPQGAPTSPRLSNLVNVRLDAYASRTLRRRGFAYTRYADDITLSAPVRHRRRERGAFQYLRRLLAAHGYRMHGRPKRRVIPAHQRQTVTGLVVNQRVALPREVRRRLRAIRHHHATGRPGTLTPAQMAGWTSFEAMVRRQAQGR